jgi:hypothetical protein
MALDMLCELLPLANTSPDLVQFMNNYNIDSKVQKIIIPVSRIGQLEAHILVFLSVSPFIKSVLHRSQLNYSVHLFA